MKVFLARRCLTGDCLALYLALAATFESDGVGGPLEGTHDGEAAKLLEMDAGRFKEAFNKLVVWGFVEMCGYGLDRHGWRLPWFEDFVDEVVDQGNREYWRRAKRRSREAGKVSG